MLTNSMSSVFWLPCFSLWNISCIQHLHLPQYLEVVLYAMVWSHLDCYSSLCLKIADPELDLYNSAACWLTGTSHCQHITTHYTSLTDTTVFPVKSWITFKVPMLVYLPIHNMYPHVWNSLWSLTTLISSSHSFFLELLKIPRVNEWIWNIIT